VVAQRARLRARRPAEHGGWAGIAICAWNLSALARRAVRLAGLRLVQNAVRSKQSTHHIPARYQ